MEDFKKSLRLITSLILVIVLAVIGLLVGIWWWSENPDYFQSDEQIEELDSMPTAPIEVDSDEVVDSIHVASGLIADEGYQMVLANCTGCHSADLIKQNRGTEDYWKGLIVWMQTTQGLWDLGENEKTIVQYLSKNYAPTQEGRRANLSGIKWYQLEE